MVKIKMLICDNKAREVANKNAKRRIFERLVTKNRQRSRLRSDGNLNRKCI